MQIRGKGIKIVAVLRYNNMLESEVKEEKGRRSELENELNAQKPP